MFTGFERRLCLQCVRAKRLRELWDVSQVPGPVEPPASRAPCQFWDEIVGLGQRVQKKPSRLSSEISA